MTKRYKTIQFGGLQGWPHARQNALRREGMNLRILIHGKCIAKVTRKLEMTDLHGKEIYAVHISLGNGQLAGSFWNLSYESIRRFVNSELMALIAEAYLQANYGRSQQWIAEFNRLGKIFDWSEYTETERND